MPEAIVFDAPEQYVLAGDVMCQSVQTLELFLRMKRSLCRWLDGCVALVAEVEGRLLVSQFARRSSLGEGGGVGAVRTAGGGRQSPVSSESHFLTRSNSPAYSVDDQLPSPDPQHLVQGVGFSRRVGGFVADDDTGDGGGDEGGDEDGDENDDDDRSSRATVEAVYAGPLDTTVVGVGRNGPVAADDGVYGSGVPISSLVQADYMLVRSILLKCGAVHGVALPVSAGRGGIGRVLLSDIVAFLASLLENLEKDVADVEAVLLRKRDVIEERVQSFRESLETRCGGGGWDGSDGS